MFIFTACVWSGMVMISMMISTSITSISGVVFISTITSSPLRTSPPEEPTFIPMVRLPSSGGRRPPAGGSVMKPTLAMPARWQATTTRPTAS
jgi:hypothetical protein